MGWRTGHAPAWIWQVQAGGQRTCPPIDPTDLLKLYLYLYRYLNQITFLAKTGARVPVQHRSAVAQGMMQRRCALVEHPFGTIKERILGNAPLPAARPEGSVNGNSLWLHSPITPGAWPISWGIAAIAHVLACLCALAHPQPSRKCPAKRGIFLPAFTDCFYTVCTAAISSNCRRLNRLAVQLAPLGKAEAEQPKAEQSERGWFRDVDLANPSLDGR